MPQVLDLGARQTAELIAKGELSASEAVEARIARIEAVNPKLNAVIFKRYEAARSEAKAVDARRKAGESLGPLAGVPVTIKDSIDLAGASSTFGLPSRANVVAAEDEVHVARLRAAGAVVLGKTNIAQMLLFFESDNPLFGRANNPWDLARSPGGSSGGEGAIIAAQGSLLGLGTDLGGSVRNPSAMCGLAGIKPTVGRCPDSGRFSYPLGQTVIESQVGVLARTTDDVALGLEIINGGQNPQSDPPHPLPDYRSVDVSKLKIGYFEDDGFLAPCPAARRVVREAAATLSAAGAKVFAWTPPNVGEALALYYGAFTAGGRAFRKILGDNKADARLQGVLRYGSMCNRTAQRLAVLLRALGQRDLAAGLMHFGYRSTEDYWDLVERAAAYRQVFAKAMNAAENMDLILLPSNPIPALLHGASSDLGTIGSYTVLFNLLGYPAGVAPFTRIGPGEESDRPLSRDRMQLTAKRVEQASTGLPIGVQIAGRPWRDHTVLAALTVLEAAARKTASFPVAPEI